MGGGRGAKYVIEFIDGRADIAPDRIKELSEDATWNGRKERRRLGALSDAPPGAAARIMRLRAARQEARAEAAQREAEAARQAAEAAAERARRMVLWGRLVCRLRRAQQSERLNEASSAVVLERVLITAATQKLWQSITKKARAAVQYNGARKALVNAVAAARNARKLLEKLPSPAPKFLLGSSEQQEEQSANRVSFIERGKLDIHALSADLGREFGQALRFNQACYVDALHKARDTNLDCDTALLFDVRRWEKDRLPTPVLRPMHELLHALAAPASHYHLSMEQISASMHGYAARFKQLIVVQDAQLRRAFNKNDLYPLHVDLGAAPHGKISNSILGMMRSKYGLVPASVTQRAWVEDAGTAVGSDCGLLPGSVITIATADNLGTLFQQLSGVRRTEQTTLWFKDIPHRRRDTGFRRCDYGALSDVWIPVLQSGIHTPAHLLANEESDEFWRLFVQGWFVAVDKMVMGSLVQSQPVVVHDRTNHRQFVMYLTDGDLQYDRDGEAVDENDPKFRRLRKPKHFTGKHIKGTEDWCVRAHPRTPRVLLHLPGAVQSKSVARAHACSQVPHFSDRALGKALVENRPRRGF